METSSLTDLFDKSIKLIENKVKNPLNKDIQENISRLLKHANNVKISHTPIAQNLFDIGLMALLAEPANLIVAEQAMKELEKFKNKPLTIFARGLNKVFKKSPAAKVIYGLFVLLYFVIPISVLLQPYFSNRNSIFGIDSNLLALVSIFGSLGSIVSIMVRLHEFQNISNDTSILFFTGLFKPIIGMSFALFVFAVLKAGIIPININTKVETYFFIALSFVSGFSERFAQDIVSHTAKSVSINNGEGNNRNS